jgi:hypothetical protein
MIKYKKEFKEDIMRNIVQLEVKRDYLKNRIELNKIVDDSEKNIAKVKMDIDAFTAKIDELKDLHDFIKA